MYNSEYLTSPYDLELISQSNVFLFHSFLIKLKSSKNFFVSCIYIYIYVQYYILLLEKILFSVMVIIFFGSLTIDLMSFYTCPAQYAEQL